jgi:hypothetical protein
MAFSSTTEDLLKQILDAISSGSGTGGTTAQYNNFSIVAIAKNDDNTFAADTCHCIRLINPEGTGIGAILNVVIDANTPVARIENVDFEIRGTGLIQNEIKIINVSNQPVFFLIQAGGLKTSVGELEAQQLATSQKVDNLAIYAKNTEAIGFTAQSGLTETIQNVIGKIPTDKTLYIISIGGAFGEVSTLTNDKTEYFVDNGDTLLVACSNGAIVSITHTDDRANELAVSVTKKIDDLQSGMEDEMAVENAIGRRCTGLEISVA